MDKTIQLSEHKSFEVQLSKWEATNWFNVSLKWDFKGDHCGPTFIIEIYNFYFGVCIYDHRHWNWDADRFYFPGEEAEERAKLEQELGITTNNIKL
jgi:hypothetical protein